MANGKLSGAERAAMLISAFDAERASQVLEAMSDNAVRRLRDAAESLRSSKIDREEKLVTLASFIRGHRGSPFLLGDPNTRFRQILEYAIEDKQDLSEAAAEKGEGQNRRKNTETCQDEDEDQEEITEGIQEIIREAPPQDVATLLGQESVRCAAVLLSVLPGEMGGELLNLLDVERREKILARLFDLGQVPDPVIREVTDSFREKLHESRFGSDATSEEERLDQLADMISGLEGDFQKQMLSKMEEEDNELAEEIERRIFAFEDLVHVEARSLQQLLGKIDSSTIALAIKGVDDELEKVINDNLSQRVLEQVNEERELAGSVPVSEAMEARDEIMRVAREMEREDALDYASGDKEEEYVE